MALSAAEKARRYRERIRSDPQRHSAYLQKERDRYKQRKESGKIKTVANVESEREKRNIRRKWRTQKAAERKRKKEMPVLQTPPLSPDTSGENNTDRRSTSGRKKIRRDRAKAYRTINKLQKVIAGKSREVERFRKQCYRLRVALKSPRSKTQGLTKGQVINERVKKTLLFHNALVGETKDLLRNGNAQATVAQLLRGKLLRKYRLVNMAAKAFGVSRNLSNSENRGNRKVPLSNLRKFVNTYFNRDDVSCIRPGKKDTITRNKVKKQKRLLRDSLKTLHLKFLAEHRGNDLSYSLFCKLRPFWVLIPSLKDRETCQCKLHENGQFMADMLKKWNALPDSNIEKLVDDSHCYPPSKDCMYGNCDVCKNKLYPCLAYDPGQQVQWYQWEDRQIEIEMGKGETREKKTIKRTLKGEHFGTLSQLRTEFQQYRTKLSRHIYNIRHQYGSLRSLRENQSEHSAVIHMDFSENYLCKFYSEIQSVHFGGSHQQVSLHTGISYLPTETFTFCTFSGCTRHDPSAIWAHLKPVLSYLRNIPNIETLHFLSDGPTTQYRSRKNFYMFCTTLYEYGFKRATWNFLEAGHGKGPADGVGAIIKRTADDLVKHGKDLPDAKAVFEAIQSSNIKVKTWYVTSQEIGSYDEILSTEIPAIPGTMKLHQVLTENIGEVSYRDVSCFCRGDQFCLCYDPATVVLKALGDRVEMKKDCSVSILKDVGVLSEEHEGRWCVVEYDGLPYPGIIQNVDDGEAEVKVMHRVGDNRFFWPLIEDVLWYARHKILTLTPPVEPVTGRHQRIRQDIWQTISAMLDL